MQLLALIEALTDPQLQIPNMRKGITNCQVWIKGKKPTSSVVHQGERAEVHCGMETGSLATAPILF